MTKKTITQDEYYLAVGLLTLASDEMKRLHRIEMSLAKVFDMDSDPDLNDYYGHVSDAVYNGYTIRDLLTYLKCKVEK